MKGIIWLMAFSSLGLAGCSGDGEGASGPLIAERRFYNTGDEELINRAKDAAAALTNEPNADLSVGWTPVVLRMEKLDCVKFDLDPPGIGRDVSVCFNRDDGALFDHSPVDTTSPH